MDMENDLINDLSLKKRMCKKIT